MSGVRVLSLAGFGFLVLCAFAMDWLLTAIAPLANWLGMTPKDVVWGVFVGFGVAAAIELVDERIGRITKRLDRIEALLERKEGT